MNHFTGPCRLFISSGSLSSDAMAAGLTVAFGVDCGADMLVWEKARRGKKYQEALLWRESLIKYYVLLVFRFALRCLSPDTLRCSARPSSRSPSSSWAKSSPTKRCRRRPRCRSRGSCATRCSTRCVYACVAFLIVVVTASSSRCAQVLNGFYPRGARNEG